MKRTTEQGPVLILRRTYDAPCERVFRAWLDAEVLGQWFSPEDDWPVVVEELDARVGGRCTVAFGPPGETPYVETNVFLEIVPGKRLVFTTSMTHGAERFSDTHCTVEFIDRGGRTEIVLTETGMGEADVEPRTSGWSRTLDHLRAVLT